MLNTYYLVRFVLLNVTLCFLYNIYICAYRSKARITKYKETTTMKSTNNCGIEDESKNRKIKVKRGIVMKQNRKTKTTKHEQHNE